MLAVASVSEALLLLRESQAFAKYARQSPVHQTRSNRTPNVSKADLDALTLRKAIRARREGIAQHASQSLRCEAQA